MSEPTIFIVDDDDAVRDSLKFLLESYQCHVEDYGSTRDFFEAYQPRDRQCLVLDHHLPGQTGLEFLESIDGTSLRIPVILVSGGGDRVLKQRALKAGVVAYFDKPLDNSVLLAAVFKAVEIQYAAISDQQSRSESM
jgi:two-component system response regulator FixJ